MFAIRILFPDLQGTNTTWNEQARIWDVVDEVGQDPAQDPPCPGLIHGSSSRKLPNHPCVPKSSPNPKQIPAPGRKINSSTNSHFLVAFTGQEKPLGCSKIPNDGFYPICCHHRVFQGKIPLERMIQIQDLGSGQLRNQTITQHSKIQRGAADL